MIELGNMRRAQQPWAATSVADRLAVVRRFRHELAERAADYQADPETLIAQVLPLADAARFLEKRASAILAPRRLPATGRPFWMRDVEIKQYREPFGVVLLITPSNYPLFLPGVQALQALVAGNAVIIKPGRGGRSTALTLAGIFEIAGLPTDLLRVLDEAPEAAGGLMEAGVDKVVLTGSAETGAAVLGKLAPHLTPSTMELSGDDPVFIRRDADLELAVKAIRFGATLNGGRTCIAPRRVLAAPTGTLDLRDRMPAGIEFVFVNSDDDALRLAGKSPYALGATVFGREPAASAFARRVRAGVVVVNDMIAPTADPRLAFGGRGRSGFGVTRGAEGLLEMTMIKSIVTRRGPWRPHLEPKQSGDAALFCAYIEVAHGRGLTQKLGAAVRLLRAIFRRSRS
jgi:acyl-CoA reductase-like NAD-dependent aldehyde dehydrogenase